MMRSGLFTFILLVSNLQSPCEATETSSQDPNVGADHSETNTTGFTVEYTLIIANSPDCEPSLVDNYPVRVQYREIIGGDGGQWMDSPNMPGN